MYSTVFFLVFAVWSAVAQDFTCDPVTGEHAYCACKMSDGSGIVDISPYASRNSNVLPRFIGHDDNYQYLYNPCYPINVAGVAACSFNRTAGCQLLSDTDGHTIGQYNLVDFSVDPDTKNVILTYSGGDDNRIMKVTLVCNPDKDEPEFIVKGEVVKLQYDFILESKCSCPYKEFVSTCTSDIKGGGEGKKEFYRKKESY